MANIPYGRKGPVGGPVTEQNTAKVNKPVSERESLQDSREILLLKYADLSPNWLALYVLIMTPISHTAHLWPSAG